MNSLLNKVQIITALLLCLFPLSVKAYSVGDVTGYAMYSGNDTYINNYPIEAYHMDGRQLICAEDLCNYGFSVDWIPETKSLEIKRDSAVTELTKNNSIKRRAFLADKRAFDIVYSDINVYINGEKTEAYSINGKMLIKLRALEPFGEVSYSEEKKCAMLTIDGLSMAEYMPLEADYDSKITVVIDPGHGKASWLMSDDEKYAAGYSYSNGNWGEWRHRKNGSSNEDCFGEGCNHYGSCRYGITNGDRDTEPEINLKNALAAKTKLEEMGYNVRMTRMTNDENPSFNNRVACCFPNNDLNAVPDAACYVCIHSNAGGGKGSAYIKAEGSYSHKWINSAYAYNSNLLGEYINNKIVEKTSLKRHSDGSIDGLGYMILFNKCPVPAGYIEIGFYDSSDLSILNNEYNEIGMAIAEGIDEYMRN